MKTMMHSLGGLVAAASVGHTAMSGFTGFVVTSTNVTNSGRQLTVYNVYARFDGPTDTVLNYFNLGSIGGSSLVGFWHKDNSSYNSGVLSQEFGTWNPSQTGSTTANRPFDSYLTVGGVAAPTNSTNADPSWVSGGNADARGWSRPDLPTNGTCGWFNANPPNLQGRVGVGANTATDVMVGQFVLSQGHCVRNMTLTLGYNDGVPGSAVQFGTSTFMLGSPGTLPTWYRDVDGDGFGAAEDGTLVTCEPPTGYALLSGDNCPEIANPDQSDSNANSIGDACELARGDLNLDGVVNASDLPLLFNAWGGSAGGFGDLNFDGAVDAQDFSILLANWGTSA